MRHLMMMRPLGFMYGEVEAEVNGGDEALVRKDAEGKTSDTG